MTTKEITDLYDALIEYRKGEDPRISRTYSWKNRYTGTEVNYKVNEYNIVCKFWLMAPDEWEMSIHIELHNDARYNLIDPITFDHNIGLTIPNTIDKLIEALRMMPPVEATIKAKFVECLNEVGGDL